MASSVLFSTTVKKSSGKGQLVGHRHAVVGTFGTGFTTSVAVIDTDDETLRLQEPNTANESINTIFSIVKTKKKYTEDVEIRRPIAKWYRRSQAWIFPDI